jgi:dipeptidyl aminopeptidase/acylaminoacyl peptidase
MLIEHDVDGKARLEYPPGKVVPNRRAHQLAPASPDGKEIAFRPSLSDRRPGRRHLLELGDGAEASAEYESLQGLAWSPDGREIWFTAAETGQGRSLIAVTRSGKERVLSKVPGSLTLRDISKTGVVLLTHDNVRKGIIGLGAGQPREREFSWLEWSIPMDLSDDGSKLLFNEQGQATGDQCVAVCRKTDGSPVIRLGDGVPRSLSPDGQWVVSTFMQHGTPMRLLPTGTGQARPLPSPPFSSRGAARWLPDGRSIVFGGTEVGKSRRIYVQNVEGGALRAISPPDLLFTGFILSADGKTVIVRGQDKKLTTVPIDGGPARPFAFPADLADLTLIRFSGDGRSLFVRDNGRIPVGVFRLDVASGRKELVRELSPGDPAGLQAISMILLSSDGRSYAYGYTRALSDLYAVDGLK